MYDKRFYRLAFSPNASVFSRQKVKQMETNLIITMRIFLYQHFLFQAFSLVFFFRFSFWLCVYFLWSHKLFEKEQKSIRLTAALNDFSWKIKLLWISVCVQYAVLSAQCSMWILDAATNANNLCWKHNEELCNLHYKNVVWIWSVIILCSQYYAQCPLHVIQKGIVEIHSIVFSFVLMQTQYTWPWQMAFV